jgi:ribosomal-protein-alanine N-acetyltransferase
MSGIAFPIGGIDDGVVRLRLHSDADLPAMVAACRDPEIARWTRVPESYDLEDAQSFRKSTAQRQAEGTGLSLVVAGAEDGELLGSVGIVEIDPDEGRCELGYWLAKEARGRGLMTRSVRLLCGWIFVELEIERIGIHVEPDNASSRAVAEAAGFQFEGVLRSFFINKGRRRDAAFYSLLRHELPQPR